MSEINEKLAEYVKRLTDLTEAGSVPWYRASPTVLVWDSHGSTTPARVTLQRAERMLITQKGSQRKYTYLLQMQDPKNKSSSLSVDSKDNEGYQQFLSTLYESASRATDARAADFLQDLLKGLN